MNARAHRYHPVVVGAIRDVAGPGALTLLQRSDDDFLGATLHALRGDSSRRALNALVARTTNASGALKLFQPIQRQFHVALIEAWCDQPGTPRIDPKRVDSAGFVLRRLDAQGRPEGWMRLGGRARGWVPLSRIGGDGVDPLATKRAEAARTGVADIDRELAELLAADPDRALDEDMQSLHLAPPDVCTGAGKTLYYGVVCTASSEFSGEDAVVSAPGDGSFSARSALFRSHLVEALRGQEMDLPFAGSTLRAGWADVMEAVGEEVPAEVTSAQAAELRNRDSAAHLRMRRFLQLLRQLGGEFGAFDTGTAATAEGTSVRRVLDEIELPLKLAFGETVRRHVLAGSFLSSANAALFEKANVGTLEMPERWPELSSSQANRLADALHAAMQARFRAVAGKAGRYDEPNARYVLRPFLRLKAMGPCQARIVWGGYSVPFVIAPWYEGAGAPPVQVVLPDPSNRSLLKALKPNVSFVVPPGLQNLLSGPAKDLLEGKGSTGTLGITWVCSFSIPIITICAFIVLNIFLTLLNIVFWWMPFLKICLPLPRFGNNPPGSG